MVPKTGKTLPATAPINAPFTVGENLDLVGVDAVFELDSSFRSTWFGVCVICSPSRLKWLK